MLAMLRIVRIFVGVKTIKYMNYTDYISDINMEIAGLRKQFNVMQEDLSGHTKTKEQSDKMQSLLLQIGKLSNFKHSIEQAGKRLDAMIAACETTIKEFSL